MSLRNFLNKAANTQSRLDEVSGEGGLVVAEPVASPVDQNGDGLQNGHDEQQPAQPAEKLHVEVRPQSEVLELFGLAKEVQLFLARSNITNFPSYFLR